ncbi:MAG: FtsW/RodA/SpoVE family cell cycle protein [Clostridia bacterium]|nr:FtsW/RodA/SpoVE family cell cycle protein [Clostridia bacterium]
MKRFWFELRSYFAECDISLFLAGLISSLYGLALIYSATRSYGSDKYFIVQIIGIALGLVLYFLMTMLDVEQISRLWKWLFAINLIFISSTLFFGVGMDSTGNNSWLRVTLGGFQIGIQPGEVGKILFVMTLAKHIHHIGEDINKFRNIILLGLHFLITAGVLFISSEDMGMTLSYLFIFTIMLLVAGLKLRWFGGAIVAFASVFTAAWKLDVIPTYMQKRFLAVLDPTFDITGVGWQAYCSKIAIVGGGLFGQGYGQGLQTQSGSLPAKHTDFIFSVACEELGFLGALIILGLIFFMICKCFAVTFRLGGRSYLGSLSAGVGAVLLFQVLINCGMCLGIIPVIGLTLPFFSYGGTSVMTMFLALGLVASARRFGAQPAGLSKFRY